MAEHSNPAKPTIATRSNGPLLVTGLQHLRNSKGERLTTTATIALCRCGGSDNKPFCDGTHRKNGFTDAHAAEREDDKLERYDGPEVTILDNRFLCAHVGECTDGLPEVFGSGKDGWITPDGAEDARIREVIGRCPSGALAFSLGGGAAVEVQREPAITVSKDGPYFVVGGCDLQSDLWGEGASREHYALCRCGQSNNKPFCDGSHWDAKFTDEKN